MSLKRKKIAQGIEIGRWYDSEEIEDFPNISGAVKECKYK